MKWFFRLLFVLLCNVVSYAQQQEDIPHFSRKRLDTSSSVALSKGWLFKSADDAAMAMPAYDDRAWIKVRPAFVRSDSKFQEDGKLQGIGWFRYHFTADSSLVNVPLSVRVEHLGASEIYVDGRKIGQWGRVGDARTSSYFEPRNFALSFVLLSAGEHVIAVRYANFAALRNAEVFNEPLAGFNMFLGLSDSVFAGIHSRGTGQGFIFSILCGIFLALGLAHIFMFIYNKESRSNLYFCIFCFCVSASFLLFWVMQIATSPRVILSSHFISPIVMSCLCVSLSGFMNELFGTGRKRFLLISLNVVIALGVFLLLPGKKISYVLFALAVAIVMFETMVLSIGAMMKRKPGAMFIGSGILLFAILTFGSILYALVFHDVNFGENNPWEMVFVGALVLAIVSFPISISLFLAWRFAYMNRELKKNLVQVQELSDKTIQQEQERIRLIEGQKEKLETEVLHRTAEVVSQKEKIERQHDELKSEKKRSDDLLLNILPEEIAEELKQKGHTEARLFNNVTVLFTDFVNFTQAGERMGPQELVDELHTCFKAFDEIIQRYGIEKIKTIGDAYLAVAGVPKGDAEHATHVVNAALDIRQFIAERKMLLGDRTFEVRMGIHSGSVVAGIVGIKKFAYDIWGDTVNTAARMEQSGAAGKINISRATYELVKEKFVCEDRGMVEAKNKGELSMYFVEGRL